MIGQIFGIHAPEVLGESQTAQGRKRSSRRACFVPCGAGVSTKGAVREVGGEPEQEEYVVLHRRSGHERQRGAAKASVEGVVADGGEQELIATVWLDRGRISCSWLICSRVGAGRSRRPSLAELRNGVGEGAVEASVELERGIADASGVGPPASRS